MKILLKHCDPAGLSIKLGNLHLTSKPDFLSENPRITLKTSLQSGKNKEISRFKNISWQGSTTKVG
jgi:hypothetical protein